MKTVELRRHSIRGEGKDLSPFGIQLARDARRSLAENYDLILTSPKRRCRQTLEALGFRRWLVEPRLGPLDYSGFEDLEKRIAKVRKKKKVSWLEAAFQVKEAPAALREAAKGILKTAADIASFLPEGGRALAVTHSDVPELSALAAFPTFDLRHLGRPFSFCEGVALRFDGERLAGAEVLRLGARGGPAPAPREAAPA
jgi:broad specificity phosphatase PhoE